jgi:GT2 family glycosyltransferase
MKIPVTVSLTTMDRYTSILPLSLLSIINQSYLPDTILIADDSKNKTFYQHDILRNLIKLCKLKNINIEYYHGESKGQVHAQNLLLNKCNTPYLFKMDDDNILESNVLETLYNTINGDDNIGAVSGLIFCCEQDINRQSEENEVYNKIENIFSHFNIQMCGGQDKSIKNCQHLYSNYLFRKDIVNTYPVEFSPAGHREDTVFSHLLYRQGYYLKVNPNCITWHIHTSGGNKKHGFHDVVKNEELFIGLLEEWGVLDENFKIIREKTMVYCMKNNERFFIYSGENEKNM